MTKRTMTVIDGGGSGKGGSRSPPGGGATDTDAWREKLVLNRDRRIEPTLHNTQLILEHDELFAGAFWLDESSNQIILERPMPWRGGQVEEFTDVDGCELAAWLQHPDHYGMSVSSDTALRAVIMIARRYRQHAIREYLRGLEWDGTPRVERMFVELFGAEDRLYTLQAARSFMVSAVSRILWVDPKRPFVGSKVDFMLVLEGRQGKKKTSVLEELFGAKWYVETLESPSGKDFYQVIQGCWGVEIAEMDSFTKSDVTAVKGAITRRVDKFRAPYERMPRSYRRECVFVGTTNEQEYLRDHTGGRRFLPVRVLDDASMDVAAVTAARDQLWAEAVHLFDSGVEWWRLPDDIEEEQEARFTEDSWEGRTARWLAGVAPGEHAYPLGLVGRYRQWVTTDEVLVHAIGVDAARHGRPEQMRVAHIMKRLGWRHERIRTDDGRRERRWLSASSAAPSGSDPAPAAQAGSAFEDDPFHDM